MPPNVFPPTLRAEDLRRAARDRPAFWASLLVLAAFLALAGLNIYVGWPAFFQPYIPQSFWPATLILLALTPGVLWLAAFALADDRADDARRMAFLVWLLTGALYPVTVLPLETHIFQISQWPEMTWWVQLAERALVSGPLEMFLVFLVLRYGVLPASSFRSMVDGPLHGTAAGLGLAGIVMILSALSSGVDDLSHALVLVMETAVGFAVLGAILGYFLGQFRFRRTNLFYLPVGMLLAILLDALFFSILDFIRPLALFMPPFDGLILAGAFALVTYLVIYFRIRKHNRAFMAMATKIEIKKEADQPRSLLADVMTMVETNQLAVHPPPPESRPDEKQRDEDIDELDSLKHSWDVLIAEQEGKSYV